MLLALSKPAFTYPQSTIKTKIKSVFKVIDKDSGTMSLALFCSLYC